MGGVRSEVAKKLQNSDWEMRSAFPFQPVLNDIVIFQAMRPKPGLNAIIFPFNGPIFHWVNIKYTIYRYLHVKLSPEWKLSINGVFEDHFLQFIGSSNQCDLNGQRFGFEKRSWFNLIFFKPSMRRNCSHLPKCYSESNRCCQVGVFWCRSRTNSSVRCSNCCSPPIFLN